jgi:hypothetical protein
MTGERSLRRLRLGSLAAFVLGGIGCILGAVMAPDAFFPAWLVAFLYWLAMPLGAVALILVHDLTGGRWMATARPVLNAAAATMPLATIAFLPILGGLGHLYPWSHPGGAPGNAFYLNEPFFIARAVVYLIVWNLLAAYALWFSRADGEGAPPHLAWISGIGLLLMAYTVTFASIDWVLSIEPHFWSSIFPMFFAAGEFNASLALVCLVVALRGPPVSLAPREFRSDLRDLTAILLATIMFWGYTEYCQFLVIWEENLRTEIVWYVRRMAGPWKAVMYAIAAAGFGIPFLVLIWGPAKRSRAVVAAICALVLAAHLVDLWWLILPEYPQARFGLIDLAAPLALGGLWCFLFLWRLEFGRLLPERRGGASRRAVHG